MDVAEIIFPAPPGSVVEATTVIVVVAFGMSVIAFVPFKTIFVIVGIDAMNVVPGKTE